MTNNIRTSKYLIEKITADVDAGKFYIVIGNHSGVSSNVVNYSYNNIEDVKTKNIFGKKVKSADCSPVIPSITWISGTVYERADNHTNNNFYVLNQNDDVFKCIWNNGGEASTSEPITKSETYLTTADGYIWKYMYTISSGDMSKFAFTGYIPVSSNASIVNTAVNESIDYIEVLNGGQNYSVHNSGTIQQNIGSNVYRIANTASDILNVYVGSSLYVENGTSAGLLKTISGSFSNSSGKYISFSSNTTLSTDSEYIISPRVVVESHSGSGFEAYSTITENNTVDKIVIINNGSDYVNPTVSLYTTATVTAANLNIITSPQNGHGYDPVEELGATRLVFTSNFLLAEDTTLPESNFSYYNTSLVYAPNTAVAAQNTASWGASFDVNATFSTDDFITGDTSSAKGIVYWANTSHVKLNTIIGTFSNNEIIFNQSGVNSTINIIKDKDVETSSGKLLQYTIHEDGIHRSLNISENIKYIFKLESN
jgi:hypothetical protein